MTKRKKGTWEPYGFYKGKRPVEWIWSDLKPDDWVSIKKRQHGRDKYSVHIKDPISKLIKEHKTRFQTLYAAKVYAERYANLKDNPKRSASGITLASVKRKIQTLVDRIADVHGTSVSLSVFGDRGKVDFVNVNSLKGGNIAAAKRAIRSWAKKNKVKLKGISKSETTTVNPTGKSKKHTPKKKPKRTKKRPQVPPPFKRLTKGKINKLKKLFRVHPEAVQNPDPGDCPTCGMAYKDLKTGLDFDAVKDMLWIQDDNPEFWRHKRRGSVLGLWYEIKRGMWADHLEMCKAGEQITEPEYLDYLEELEY
jgi:hypothetical protein